MCLFNLALPQLYFVSPIVLTDHSLLTHSLNKFTQEGKSFFSFEGLLLLET